MIKEILPFSSRFPRFLDRDNPAHLFAFKKMLEWAMTNGLWNGTMGAVS